MVGEHYERAVEIFVILSYFFYFWYRLVEEGFIRKSQTDSFVYIVIGSVVIKALIAERLVQVQAVPV